MGRAFAAAARSVDAAAVERAALLCKNDLTTQMVKEFPELEGIVGGLYAAADRLEASVATAISNHYLPRSLEDPIPATAEGAVVSLADRLDSQAGIFLLGLVPTGSRDPYALRRSVQGACRILVETGVGLSLRAILLEALRGYDRSRIDGALSEEEALAALLQFYAGRQEYLGTEAGVRPDSVRAALAASSDDPSDARARMMALDTVRDAPGFDDLAVSHKRIKNILKDRKETLPFHPDRLRDDAERALGGRLEAARPEIESARLRRDPGAALRSIAALREPLDRFFQEVMVLAEDRSLRDNRVALLQEIAALFLAVADFSELGAAPAAAHKEA
jgi:glycyl-tRNA synthetase beta chain